MRNGEGVVPHGSLSIPDKRLLASLDGASAGDVLRRWVGLNSECQTALANCGLNLPAQIPIANEAVRGFVFTDHADGGGCTIVQADFNVFDAGRDDRVISSGGFEHSDLGRLIQERIIVFFDLLRAGLLKATSDEGGLRPAVWSRQDGVLLVETSDLVLGDRSFHSVCLKTRVPRDAGHVTLARKGGRPEKYDWDSVIKIVVTIANSPNGLPETQDHLIRKVQEAYEQAHGKEAPSPSRLKEKLKPWLPDKFARRS